MNKHTFITLILIALFTFNCKSSKLNNTNTANYNLSTKQLIKLNTKQATHFNTLQAKLKISYLKNQKEQTHSVSFRAKKDEILWLSASFSIVRAKITPEKIRFYNKLDKSYFEGDYQYISNLLGTTLNFNNIQNLLFGEPLFSLNNKNYQSKINQDAYLLEPQKQNTLYNIFFLLDPSNFKIKTQEITQPKTSKKLQINYLSHQEVADQILPKHIKINAVEANQETIIKLEFKNIILNENLRFPFKIPSGFKQIEL